MSKYIGREALIAEFKRLKLGENSFIERVFADGVYAIIEQFPAADVAPVVRCKDCKYRDGTPGQPNILCAQMHEDDFCSYGERKEESHDRLQKDL
nr:MAG TPA: hypothetical protein [Myoviridae sp. ctsKG11]